MTESVKQNLLLVPAKPGVYLMKNSDDEIIYIGKAKNLNKRVTQYFNRPQSGKVAAMVFNVDHFETIITKSEKEAFILEMNLIKKHYPRYNILLKDSKHYPYIALKRKKSPVLKIARDDKDKNKFTDEKRKSLSSILSNKDKNLPIIMMDHQPFNLEQAQQNGIDLQLSGHTHNGQLWPANYIVDKIYEVAWGYKLINKTHYYVSCGVGGWGPPVRTGSRPEIVNIKLRFAE